MLINLSLLRRSVLLIVYFTVLYLSFFYTLWLPGNHIDGSDAAIKHYPSREYLYNQLVGEHKFPFYTKKAFGGFPIYADYEIGYTNPINVLSIVVFGPFLSYKILHALTYIISSLAMYAFLARRGVNLWGITASLVLFLYSFFMENHQIHFNIIMTVPLLPVGLFVVDKWLDDGRMRCVIYLSLLLIYIYLWGHPQTLLLMLIAMFTYAVVRRPKVKSLKQILQFWLTAGVISAICVLPMIVKPYELYKESARVVDVTEGSFNSVMLLNIALPLQYYPFDNYQGMKFFESGAFSYTETYIYVGIVGLIFGLVSFLYSKTTFSRYAGVLVLLFLVLTTVREIPFAGSLPVISMFRQWNRSVILGSLGVAFLVADLFVNKDIELNRKRLLMFCTTMLFIVIRILVQIVQQDNLTLIAVDRLDVFKQIHAVWVMMLILSVFTVLVLYRFGSKRPALFIIIPILVFIDVRYYASDPLATRIGKVNPSSRIYISGLTDKMVINYQTIQLGYQHLNANYNSPFGDSQFLPKAYLKKFEGYGFNSKLKGIKGNEIIGERLVEDIGLEFVVGRDGKIIKAEDLGSSYTP